MPADCETALLGQLRGWGVIVVCASLSLGCALLVTGGTGDRTVALLVKDM